MTAEYFVSGTKKGRGRSQGSLDLIDKMREIAEDGQPITGRGVGYKLFSEKLIPSMSKKDMRTVYRLLKDAREEGTIPWEWIVDETRTLEKVSSWDNPADYMRTVTLAYRKDFWMQQPERVEVWSEKGTIRGVLQPVLDEYGVGFRVVHGFAGAPSIHDVLETDFPTTILYLGDFDPSGMWMSEIDIPKRLAQYAQLPERYGSGDVSVRRIALTRDDCKLLGRKPAFNVSEKKKDTRTPWFKKEYGQLCWELDAMDPNDLRDRVKDEINNHIEPVAWERCEVVAKAERESMQSFFKKWKS